MTDAALDTPEVLAERRDKRRRERARKLRFRLVWLPFITGGALVALALLLAVGVRFAVLTDAGRTTVVGWLDGMRLSRFGTLQLSGLSGDVFGDFHVKRLAVVDEKGVWLEGRNVSMRWRSVSLLRRRLWADEITADWVRVYRRPILEEREKKPRQDLPVAIRIDNARFRLLTDPAFSVQPGDYNVFAQTRIARDGPLWAEVAAESLMRAGDGVAIAFEYRKDRFDAAVDAVEVAGGALAGSLGLPSDRQFVMRLRAQGRPDQAQLSLITLSGDTVPAAANGRWDGKQGYLRAGIDLTAFDVTESYVPRIGERLGVVADIDPVDGSLFHLNAAVAGANLRASADGRVNVAERTSPDGLAVRASSGSLSRLVGAPLAGFTEAEGVLKGGLADMRFAGRAGTQGFTAAGYRLATVGGPVQATWRGGELNVTTGLQGRGGAGQGLVAAWLGAAPRANVEVARLRDGRLLVRSLDAVGAGMRLQGSGSRGLLGDLAFKGEGVLSNLASVRPGAQGVLNASFDARQSGDGRPWAFSLDARGDRLATGMAQLDRLLGAKPRLQMTAAYGSNQLQIERATLDGAAGSVSGAGMVATSGALDVDLNWRANGPFQAGPVQIAGAIRGEGTIDGSFASPRADLTAHVGTLDLPQLVLRDADVGLTFARNDAGYNGFVRIRAGSAYGPARGDAGFRFVSNGVDLRDVDIAAAGVTAKGAVSLRNGAPTTADFTVAAGPGAFLSRGQANGVVRLVDGPGGTNAGVRIEGRDLAFKGSNATYIQTLSLTAAGPLSRLPFTVSATGEAPQPYRFAGDGVYSRQGEAQVISLGGAGRVRQFDLRTVEPAVLRLAPNDRSARVRLAVGGGTVSVDGRQAGDTLNANATFDDLQVGTLNEDFSGRIDGTASLQGRGARLTGRLDAALQQARSLDAPNDLALNGRVQAVLADNRVRVTASATNPTGLRANVDAVLPTTASASPLRLAVNRTQPISGSFGAEGELRPLWDLFYGGERILAGYVSAEGTLGGTLNDPRPRGRASVVRGRFEDQTIGFALRDLRLQAELGGDHVYVRELTAADGSGGTVNGGGEINLRLTGGSSFRADLKSFRLIDNELAEADATGVVTARRDANGQISIGGRLRIDEAVIRPNPPTPSGVVRMDVVERNAPERARERQRQARPSVIALDLALEAPRDVWVRGRGLNVELGLDAAVTGTLSDPNLTGVARVVRGDYEFAGRRFEFDQRGTIRLGETAEEIRLDLIAVREDPTLTAEIRVRGTAAEPEITLTSRPQLPQDEILSQVLFGRSASQLSPVEAAQLASALSGLAGGGGFDVIGGLREFAGLDRLSFGGEGAGMTVAGGKYISDDVYLEIIGGGIEGAAVAVEYQITRRLSIISRIGQNNRLSVRYRRERR